MAVNTFQLQVTTNYDIGPGDIAAGKRPNRTLDELINFLAGVAAGARNQTSLDLQVNGLYGVRASGTFTVAAGNLSAADTVTVQGTALTAVASGANGTTQFNIGAASPGVTAAMQTAINLAATANANTTLKQYVVASAAAVTTTGVVTFQSLDYGPLSNAITLAKTATNGAVSGATLAGGTRVANALIY